MMNNFKLTLEYDGTDFNGWQSQPNGRTVQDVLEAALAEVLQRPVRVNGACRTDSGVHAKGQVANFRIETERRCEEILRGGNANLPMDAAILEVKAMDEGFDSRRDAIFRRYQYVICNSPVRPVIERRRAVHIGYSLDLAPMQEACRHLLGEHDFSGFRSVDCRAGRTLLTLEQAELIKRGDCILFNIGCRSFLMNMVRILGGTLVEIGRGKLAPDIIDQILESGDRRLSGPTLPPHGLTLMEVRYPK